MINCFTCARGFYRVTINDTASATDGSKNSIKKGFLSCFSGVHNSLISLKKTIGRSCTGLASMLHLSAVKAPAVPVNTSLNPISVSDTRAFCHALQIKMATNHDYLNHMFRRGTTMTNSQFNEQLKDMKAFISAINSEKIDNVTASVLVKKFIAGIMEGKKFTPRERVNLAYTTDPLTQGNELLESRFDRRDATGRENRDKLNLLLSVFKSYRDVCEHSSDIKGLAYSTNVADTIGSALFFDYDLTRLYDRTTQKQEEAEMRRAFAALLSTCVRESL